MKNALFCGMLCAAFCLTSCYREDPPPTKIDCYFVEAHSGDPIEGLRVYIHEGTEGFFEMLGNFSEDSGEHYFSLLTDADGHFELDISHEDDNVYVRPQACFQMRGQPLSYHKHGIFTMEVNPRTYINLTVTDKVDIHESYEHIVMLGPVMSDGSCGELKPTATFQPAAPDTLFMEIMPGVFDVGFECYTHKGEMVYKQYELHIPKCDTVLFAMPY